MSLAISLGEDDVSKLPLEQFEKWYKDAIMNSVREADAMLVSTVGPDNRPSARVVYLRDFGTHGFVFYTNYKSRKGQEIAYNSYCCMNFFWPELGRQIRIEGKLQMQCADDSSAYFAIRPRESQIGAWASPQSQIIASRKELDERVAKMTKEFDGKDVTRPLWWGGFVLIPDYFEFWQGRDSRLHDRITYTIQPDGSWKIGRLAP